MQNQSRIMLLSFLCVFIMHAKLDAFTASKRLSHSYWHADGTPVMNSTKALHVDEEPSGLPGVDCIYLINLDRRPARLERMQKTLDEFDLHFQRVSAVDGQQLSKETKQALFGNYPIRLPNGAIGCLLSHLSILQDAYSREYNCIWILEDDVLVKEDPHVLAPLLKELEKQDPDWDLFYTDIDAKDGNGNYVPPLNSDFRPGQPARHISYYQEKQKLGEFFRIRQRYGTWSMFVSRSGMQKLLNYYQHVYLWGAYDIDLFYAPNLHCYTTSRDIVTQWLEGQYSDTSE